MRIRAYLAAASIAAASICVLANEAAQKVPALPASATPSLLGFFQVILALLLVIAAILATAWMMRRFAPGHLGGPARLKVVGGAMVGAKERVVVVEIRDTWLVLGVTPSNVTTLHSLPKPEDAEAAPATTMPFAERLAGVLKARAGHAGEGGQA